MLVYVYAECGTVSDTTTLEAALLQAENNSSTPGARQQQVTRGGVWVSGQGVRGNVKTCWCMCWMRHVLAARLRHSSLVAGAAA
jgi:hypothetical protein